MKKLITISLILLSLVACNKDNLSELDKLVEENTIDTIDNVVVDSISYLALLSLEGNLCDSDGGQVFVITDTLYPRYISIGSNYHCDTIWYTEFFYTVHYGNRSWCNPEYLIECDN